MNDILQYAIANGIIDLRGVAKEVELKKLESHHIWKGKNGYYYSKVNGKLIKRKELTDLNNALLDLQDKQTVSDIFNLYLANKRNIADSTRYRYKKVFKTYFKKIKNNRVDTFTEYRVEQFINDLIINGITANGYAKVKLLLNGIFKMARKRGLISFRISETLEDIEISNNDFILKQRKKETLDTEEYHKTIKYLKDNLNILNLGLLLILKTGLRVGELVALKPEDIGKDYITVRRTEQLTEEGNIKTDKTKTEMGTRQVLLADQDLWILNEIRLRTSFNEYVFEYNTWHFRNRLTAICKILGIEHISPHKLRKTYASRLYASGVDERFICTQLGHTNITCTKQYYIKDTLTHDEKKAQLRRVT